MESVKPNIHQAIIYNDGALVTRQEEVVLKSTDSTFIIKHLPLNIDKESLKIKAFGKGEVKIEGFDLKEEILEDISDEKILKLQDKIDYLNDEMSKIKNEIKRVEIKNKHNENLKNKFVHELPYDFLFNKITSLEIGQFLELIKKNSYSMIDETIQFNEKYHELKKKRNLLKNQLAQLNTNKHHSVLNCIISFQVITEGSIKFLISYNILGCFWNPFYDARLLTESNELEVTYHANVNQSTGEDWNDTQLVLSTAKPTSSTSLPDLNPWFITMGKQLAIGFSTGSVDDFSYAPEEENKGMVVNFIIPQNTDVPSDGSEQKTTIAFKKFKTNLQYVVIPKITEHAYIKVITANTENYPFLKGPVSLFHDYNFIGHSQINDIVPNEDLELFMGIDESIKVKRELINKLEGNKGFSNNTTFFNYKYNVVIENLKEIDVSLTLFEPFPISRNSEIKVKIEKTSPEAKIDEEKGVFKWKLNLKPSEIKEISFEYQVEYPKEKILTGLE